MDNLNEYRNKNDKLNSKKAILESKIEEIKSGIGLERQRKQELLSDLNKLETELKSKKIKLEKLEKKKNDIKKKSLLMKNSRSWRYMEPARKLGRLVRGREKTPEIQESVTNKKKETPTNSIRQESQVKPKTKDPVELMREVQPINEDRLKSEYVQKKLNVMADTFVLYRIIGNDLYPRHKKGQTRENIQFILENELELKNCKKKWIVNRIIDKKEEEAIISMLNKHKQEFIQIPFVPEEYKEIGLDLECLPEPAFFASEEFEKLDSEQKDKVYGAIYRLKNNYIMNNNGARNAALEDGKKHAKWVLPWDGNCFLTPSAWEKICVEVTSSAHLKYFAVPMTRVTDNSLLLSEDFIPDPVEEPQLIFRLDSEEQFNSQFCYGRRPKVELFWRLGIPGKWDRWKDDSWDVKRREPSPEFRQFGVAGWVARMNSGMSSLEQDDKQSFKNRGLARLEAILTTIRHVDALISSDSNNNSERLMSLSEEKLNFEIEQYNSDNKESSLHKLIDKLISDADVALTRGPYSVVDKTTLPPSGNVNDYWHPAPYWWPNPNTADGLPYVRRDGERVPGTRMYEPESDKYDRSRLQRVFDDSIILALAWKFTRDSKYAKHGARILEKFFVNPDTRMNPHLNYSQVRMGRNNNVGASTGIIEMKDLYYYLDAVRLLIESRAISGNVLSEFKKWLREYLQWLIDSPQGKKERIASNNHGTYYDLQIASIAAFLNERTILYETLVRAQSRIPEQFTVEGAQPEELTRTITAHYCCFNYQGWINLSKISMNWGIDILSYRSSDGGSLRKGALWLLSFFGKEWPYEQIDEFDLERFYPIAFGIPKKWSSKVDELYIYDLKPKFFPHDGIQPYWNLGNYDLS